MSGKAGGYYGCPGAAKGACDNKMLVRRKLGESIILKAVREQLGQTEHIRYLLEQVEAEVAKLYAHIPATVRTKEAELGAEERRLANFIDFIDEARGSQALAKALVETERRVEALREELDGLRRSREKVFQAPPVEWIEERLAGMQEVLERRTDRSALSLRSLLGQICLEPAQGQIGRAYYLARTSLDTLVLLAPPPGQDVPDGGSNSLRWWRRPESNPPAVARTYWSWWGSLRQSVGTSCIAPPILAKTQRMSVTPGSPSKSASAVTICARWRFAVARMMASAIASPCSSDVSAASSARLSSSGTMVVARNAATDSMARSSPMSRRTTL